MVVKAAARATGLLRPQDKARLTRPPLLVWQSVTGASYYNVQLWSTGPGGQKLLSIWPTTNHLQLTAAWTFQGEMRTFTPGKYVWYIWPGFGLLAAGKYGKLLGSSTFVVG